MGESLDSYKHRAPSHKTLVIVLLVAVAVRVTMFWVSTSDPASTWRVPDSHGYLTLAQNMVEGKGFARFCHIEPDQPLVWRPELCRTPGYPALIASMQWLTGRGESATLILQHLLGVLVCLLGTIICHRHFGPTAGLWAGCMLALDLQGAALANLVLTGSLSGVLVLVVALWITRALHGTSIISAAALGLFIGGLALVKPIFVALPTAAALGLFLFGYFKRQPGWLGSTIAVLVMGNIVLVGWIVRNGVRCGEYTFSSIPRYNLLQEHAAGALARDESITYREARKIIWKETGVSKQRARSSPLSAEQNERIRNISLNHIISRPRAFLAESVVRTAMLLVGPEKHVLHVLGIPPVSLGVFDGDPESFRRAGVGPLTLLAVQVLFVLSIYALVVISLFRLFAMDAPARWLIVVCLLLAGYILLLSSGAPGAPRYRWPAMPMLIFVAAAAWLPRKHRHNQMRDNVH